MATIQVRNVPDSVHRTYQSRAVAAGMSLQEYVRDELVRNAARRTPAELVGEVRQRLVIEGSDGFSRASAAEMIRADRENR